MIKKTGTRLHRGIRNLVPIVALLILIYSASLHAEDYPGFKGTGYIKHAEYINNLPPVRSIQITEEELKKLYPGLDKKIEESMEPSDPSKRELLEITRRDGRYFWTSNGSKPLKMHKATITLSSRAGGRASINSFGPKILPELASFFVFTNPDGQGFIVVEHIQPIKIEWWIGHPCARGGWNYIEYKLNAEGNFEPLWGHTDPFPYPEPDVCVMPGGEKAVLPRSNTIEFNSQK